MTITLHLPEDVAAALGENPVREAFEALLAELYESGKIGRGTLRRSLGYASWYESEEFLIRHNVITYTVKDLRSDLETIERAAQESVRAA